MNMHSHVHCISDQLTLMKRLHKGKDVIGRYHLEIPLATKSCEASKVTRNMDMPGHNRVTQVEYGQGH